MSNSNSRHNSIVEMLSTPPNQQPSSSSSRADSIDTIPQTIPTHNNLSSSNISSTSSSTSDLLKKNFNLNSSSSIIPHINLDNNSINSNSNNTVEIFDWSSIKLTNLIEKNKLIIANKNISIEDAFNLMMKYNLTSLPVYLSDNNNSNIENNHTINDDVKSDDILAFNYNDLNTYLLLALNKIQIDNDNITNDCQNGKPVKVGDFIINAKIKSNFKSQNQNQSLKSIINILGKDRIHRITLIDENNYVKGIISQRRLIKYIWENARNIKNILPILNSSISELKIGNFNNNSNNTYQSRLISINGDEPLIKALYKMNIEKISSIAVVDNQFNLIGNISVTDVKHVTRTSQYPLLHKSCRHFISVILNSRGLEMGKDSFPIFHVYPNSSLGRTLAKLVATKSHRLWIVKENENLDDGLYEKEYRTGRLIGVISLTDILEKLAELD